MFGNKAAKREAEIRDKEIQMQQDAIGLQAAGQFATGFEREELRDILTYTLNNDPIIEKLERQLRGEELITKKDEKGRSVQVWEQTGDPFMREPKGISNYIAFVSSYVGKNAIFSAFMEKKEMYVFLKQVGHSIRIWCMNNHKRYGIDIRKVEQTINGTLDLIELSIRRSYMGEERQYGYGAGAKEIRYGQYQAEPKKGFFK